MSDVKYHDHAKHVVFILKLIRFYTSTIYSKIKNLCLLLIQDDTTKNFYARILVLINNEINCL